MHIVLDGGPNLLQWVEGEWGGGTLFAFDAAIAKLLWPRIIITQMWQTFNVTVCNQAGQAVLQEKLDEVKAVMLNGEEMKSRCRGDEVTLLASKLLQLHRQTCSTISKSNALQVHLPFIRDCSHSCMSAVRWFCFWLCVTYYILQI